MLYRGVPRGEYTDMTKGQKVVVGENYGWLDVPRSVRGRKPEMGARSCSFCEENFTFFNRRKSCEFCGATVHSKCLKSVRTAVGKAKMCLKCYRYKQEYSNMLMQGKEWCVCNTNRFSSPGDEFICYNGQLPAASYLYLSEEHCSVTIVVDPQGQYHRMLPNTVIFVVNNTR